MASHSTPCTMKRELHHFIIDGITYSSFKQFFDAKIVFVPYVISSVPNWRDAFIGLLGIYYVAGELAKAIKQITQWATPSGGFGIVAHIAQLILEIAFLASSYFSFGRTVNAIIQLHGATNQVLRRHAHG
jgi:hypothetical protein